MAIARLKPGDATMTKLRERVYALLQEGYAAGAAQALNEVDAAREAAPPSPPSER